MKKCSRCGTEYPDDTAVCPADQIPLEPAAPSPAKKHSGLGIASFVISVAVGGLMFLVFCAATLLSARHRPGDQPDGGQTILGMFIVLLAALDIVAVGLGMAALFQKEKKRLFAILGVAFSCATILGVAGLIIIGLMYVSKTAR